MPRDEGSKFFRAYYDWERALHSTRHRNFSAPMLAATFFVLRISGESLCNKRHTSEANTKKEPTSITLRMRHAAIKCIIKQQ